MGILLGLARPGLPGPSEWTLPPGARVTDGKPGAGSLPPPWVPASLPGVDSSFQQEGRGPRGHAWLCWWSVKEMELSFLGTGLLPVSCGGTLRALTPRTGRLEACGMWLWGKASKWMVFLRTGMRGDTPPGSFEGRAGRPRRWLWEEEVPGPGAP